MQSDMENRTDQIATLQRQIDTLTIASNQADLEQTEKERLLAEIAKLKGDMATLVKDGALTESSTRERKQTPKGEEYEKDEALLHERSFSIAYALWKAQEKGE